MAEWVQTHLPCPCGQSSDAYSISDNGWGKCFSCGKNMKEGEDDDSPRRNRVGRMIKADKSLIPFGEFSALSKRGISEVTCRKFGYFIGTHHNKAVQVAPYHNTKGEIVAQKIRTADKKFSTTGDFKDVALFGQHLWGDGGKRVTITEGEIDCLSVSQVQDNRWPVVSVPSGAQSAASAIKNNLEWILGFEEVVIVFDMDEAGQEGALEVASLLPPGRAKIAKLADAKDANEMLVQGRGRELMNSLWSAKEYRPDGILEIEDILEEAEKPIEWGLPWCFPTLTQFTYGRRWGEVYGFGAGTGVGKTDLFTQQMAHDMTELGMAVGVVYLEAKPVDTAKRMAGKVDGKRYHIPDEDWSQDQLRETLQSFRGLATFYDSWGETEWDSVKTKIRYMAVAKGIRLIYLDHLTAMADTANERESLEQLTKEMAGLANELGLIIHFISHLTTPEGKPHEEGGRVMIRHFKGSRAIGFWSHYMFGMERDQQSEDIEEQQTTTFRILKDRYTGQATGKVIYLGYDHESGLLYEKSGYGFKPESDFSSDF